MSMMRYLLLAMWFILVACAPSMPNRNFHKNADNGDCQACHIAKGDPNAPTPPSQHVEGNALKPKYKSCRGCHDPS